MNRLHFNMLLRVSLLRSESGETEKVINIETQEKFGNYAFRVAGFRNIYRRFRHGRGRTSPKKRRGFLSFRFLTFKINLTYVAMSSLSHRFQWQRGNFPHFIPNYKIIICMFIELYLSKHPVKDP